MRRAALLSSGRAPVVDQAPRSSPVAEGEEGTPSTRRSSCIADAPAVEDQKVGHPSPLRLGEQSHELTLDDEGVVAVAETEAVRDPQDVGVHGDALIDTKRVPEDDVGGLAADAGEDDELVDVPRKVGRGPGRDPLRKADNAFRLGPEETRRTDDLLHLGQACPAQRRRAWKRAKSAGVTLFTLASVHCADRIVVIVPYLLTLRRSPRSGSKNMRSTRRL